MGVVAELVEHPAGGEEWRPRDVAGGRAIAAPTPAAGATAKPGSNRIEDDIAAGFQKVSLPLDDCCAVARLEQVADVVVSSVEVVRMRAVHVVHAHREVGVGGLDEEMEVIRHQAIGRTQPTVPFHHFGQHREKPAPVEIVKEDGAALSATRRDVVDGAGRLKARAARHSVNVAAHSSGFRAESVPSFVPSGRAPGPGPRTGPKGIRRRRARARPAPAGSRA